MQIGFVACIENNKLAPEALMLFESIRRFGGRLASAPIYSYNPRGHGPLNPETYARLLQLNVSHSDQLLNDKHGDYPIANKIFAAEHAERNSTEALLSRVQKRAYASRGVQCFKASAPRSEHALVPPNGD